MATERLDTRPYPVSSWGGLSWGSIIAGALFAAALAFILHSFAAAIGLAVSSAAPTWRDASFALVLLSGLYLVVVAVLTYGLGGYLAARIRSPSTDTPSVDADYRDGVHGLLTWALATVLTGLLLVIAAQALPRLAAPSAGSAGPATSVAGENIIAFDLDRLFRGGERRPPKWIWSVFAQRQHASYSPCPVMKECGLMTAQSWCDLSPPQRVCRQPMPIDG